MQNRYGWSDKYILSIPYSRFIQIIEQEVKRKEERNRELAFLGWQITSPFRDPPVSFNEYYDSLFKAESTSSESKENPEDLKVDPKKALARAEEIINMFRK